MLFLVGQSCICVAAIYRLHRHHMGLGAGAPEEPLKLIMSMRDRSLFVFRTSHVDAKQRLWIATMAGVLEHCDSVPQWNYCEILLFMS